MPVDLLGGWSRQTLGGWSGQTQSANVQIAGSSVVTQIQVWSQWMTNATTATATNSVNVWNTWNNNSLTGSAISGYTLQQPMQPPTPEVQALLQQQSAARVAGRSEAETKAKSLMHDNLTPIQREALEKHGWFLVEGGKSGKLYRIHARSYAGNIDELDDKMTAVARLCVHAASDIPLGDQLLAQALSLRFDEDHIIAKANRTALVA